MNLPRAGVLPPAQEDILEPAGEDDSAIWLVA